MLFEVKKGKANKVNKYLSVEWIKINSSVKARLVIDLYITKRDWIIIIIIIIIVKWKRYDHWNGSNASIEEGKNMGCELKELAELTGDDDWTEFEPHDSVLQKRNR